MGSLETVQRNNGERGPSLEEVAGKERSGGGTEERLGRANVQRELTMQKIEMREKQKKITETLEKLPEKRDN